MSVLVVVGDVRGDLDAAVDGAGVHDPLARPQARLRDAVERRCTRAARAGSWRPP